MPKLNDTQAILLSHAAKRDDGSLLPLPHSHSDGLAKARASKAIAALLKLGLLEEREAATTASIHRSDGDLCYGVFLTAAGKAAIGIDDGTDETTKALPPATAAPGGLSKAAAVIELLQGDAGATTAELIAVTGWLPHTTRAALTGLRKKGHTIDRTKRDGATCYRITTLA